MLQAISFSCAVTKTRTKEITYQVGTVNDPSTITSQHASYYITFIVKENPLTYQLKSAISHPNK